MVHPLRSRKHSLSKSSVKWIFGHSCFNSFKMSFDSLGELAIICYNVVLPFCSTCVVRS